MVVLPQSFGSIFLGETFTSYVSAHNDSQSPALTVVVKVDRHRPDLVPPRRAFLTDGISRIFVLEKRGGDRLRHIFAPHSRMRANANANTGVGRATNGVSTCAAERGGGKQHFRAEARGKRRLGGLTRSERARRAHVRPYLLPWRARVHCTFAFAYRCLPAVCT